MDDNEKRARRTAATKKWREANPEHRERALAATRKWREANRDRANELARENQLKWRQANPEKHRERAKAYKDANKEHVQKTMRAWNLANRPHVNEYRRRAHYKTKYGITIEQRDQMVVDQGGCKICSRPEPGHKSGWVVDHCHASGKVRAILCQDCNLALGHAKDNPETLLKMVDYLKEYMA